MAIKKEAPVTIKVSLDENKIPEKILITIVAPAERPAWREIAASIITECVNRMKDAKIVVWATVKSSIPGVEASTIIPA